MRNPRTSSPPPRLPHPPIIVQRSMGEGENDTFPVDRGTFWIGAQASNRAVRRSDHHPSSPPSSVRDDDIRLTEGSTAERLQINDVTATGSIFTNNTSSGPSIDAPPPYHPQDGARQTVVEHGKAQEKSNVFTRFGQHTQIALCHSWLNLLLIFVPIGIAARVANLSPAVVFAVNAIAVIPLAGLLGLATETVAFSLGDTLGALLNVSFGNAVEFIIFILALVKNELRIVQASLLGSLLANLLLILGMAFFVGGMKYQEQVSITFFSHES
jgi:Ca2+:H+ antiporter